MFRCPVNVKSLNASFFSSKEIELPVIANMNHFIWVDTGLPAYQSVKFLAFKLAIVLYRGEDPIKILVDSVKQVWQKFPG